MNTQHINLPWINKQTVLNVAAAFEHSPAIVLNGPEFVGKNFLAREICTQLLDAPSLLQAGSHPDLHVLTSAKSYHQLDAQLAKAAMRYLDDGAVDKKRLSGQISVAGVRALIDAMSASSALGGHKVAIITPADHLNRNSANAMLKFLEEPTNQARILLVCHDMSRLPATVRSRCLRIDLAPASSTEAIDWLRELFPNKPRQELEAALALALKRPLLAEQYLASGQMALADQFFKDIESLFDANNVNTVAMAKDWVGRKQTDFILQWLCCCISDLIKIKSAHQHTPADSLQRIPLKKLSIDRLFYLYDYITTLNRGYDGVVDETLLIEDVLLTLAASIDGPHRVDHHATS